MMKVKTITVTGKDGTTSIAMQKVRSHDWNVFVRSQNYLDWVQFSPNTDSQTNRIVKSLKSDGFIVKYEMMEQIA